MVSSDKIVKNYELAIFLHSITEIRMCLKVTRKLKLLADVEIQGC